MSSFLIGRPIQTTLCHIWVKCLGNYYVARHRQDKEHTDYNFRRGVGQTQITGVLSESDHETSVLQIYKVLNTPSLPLQPGPLWIPSIGQTSSSSSCGVTSTNIPDPLSPPLPIVHRFWQILRSTSRILSELLHVGSSWSPCFCSAIWWGVHRRTSLMSSSLLLQ